MGSKKSRRGLGKSYRHMSYSACPCKMCSPNTAAGRRDWKRILHKSARAQEKIIISEELNPRHCLKDQ